MIAALPMYDLPWLQDANDRLWEAIAQALHARGLDHVPRRLTRTDDLPALWRDPALLLAQSCGFPFMTTLRGQVQLVATPHYRADGCDGARHRAAILIRRDHPAETLGDLAGTRAGVNDRTSNTGMNLFRAGIAPVAQGTAFFQSVTITGSHAASVEAIRDGRIDVASVDGVTLALLQDHDPALRDAVRILAWTQATPALPFVSSLATPPDILTKLRDALAAVCEDSGHTAVLDRLRLTGISLLAERDYAIVQDLERKAELLGYGRLS